MVFNFPTHAYCNDKYCWQWSWWHTGRRMYHVWYSSLTTRCSSVPDTKNRFLNSPVATFFSAAEKNAIAVIGIRVFVFRECSYISWNVSGLPRGLDISPRVSCANNFRVIIVTGIDPPVRQTSWPQMPFALVCLENPPVTIFVDRMVALPRSENSSNPWKG